jgi:hypothetical protein
MVGAFQTCNRAGIRIGIIGHTDVSPAARVPHGRLLSCNWKEANLLVLSSVKPSDEWVSDVGLSIQLSRHWESNCD